MARSFILPMRRRAGFTLLEICLAVFIVMLLVMVAVPSVEGVLSERAIKRSFDDFSALVNDAQNRALSERRSYLIVWEDEGVVLRPEQPKNRDEEKGVTRIGFQKGESYEIAFPASLIEKPPREWVFWPAGTCEAARIDYSGSAGSWTAEYNPLNVHPNLTINASH